MKLISWNIDSLNAALTSDSARAKLSQEVLATLQAENADIIAIQEISYLLKQEESFLASQCVAL